MGKISAVGGVEPGRAPAHLSFPLLGEGVRGVGLLMGLLKVKGLLRGVFKFEILVLSDSI